MRDRAGRVVARVRELVRDLGRAAVRDRVPGLSAEVAFFAVLSLFPGMLIAVGMLGFLDLLVGNDLAERAQQQTVEAADSLLTDQAEPVVESVQGVFAGRYGEVLTLSAVGALVTLSGAWAVLISALNLAYDVPEQRSWVRRRLLGLGLGMATLVVVALTLTVVVVGPLLGRGPELAESVGLRGAFGQFWNYGRIPVLFMVVVAWLLVVLRVAPNRRTAWRAALPGAVTTAVLWLLTTAGFRLYLMIIGESNPLLSAFGGGIVVMTWTYLLSLALLLGAELNAVLEAGPAKDQDLAEPDKPARSVGSRVDPAPGSRSEPSARSTATTR